MKLMKISILAIIVAALSLFIGHHRMFSTLYAQSSFSGVTFTQDVYYNCAPGVDGCRPSAGQTIAFNAKMDSAVTLQEDLDHPVGSPGTTVFTRDSQSLLVPAIGKFYTLKLIPKPAVPVSLDCSAASIKGSTPKGTKSVLGYTAYVYFQKGWTDLYFPDFMCAKLVDMFMLPASPDHPPTTTTYVITRIDTSVDQSQFVPAPGMVEDLPSHVMHDRAVMLGVAKGYSAPDADALYLTHALAGLPRESESAMNHLVTPETLG